MKVTYVGHATVLIEYKGIRILTDPILRNRVAHLQRRQKSVAEDTYKNIDYTFISHTHRDHLDIPSLKMLSPRNTIVTPNGTSHFYTDLGFKQVIEMDKEDSIVISEDIKIIATNANHISKRDLHKPSNESVGYLIQLFDKTIYFPGDTDLFPEMEDLGNEHDIDIALIPIGGWWYNIEVGHLDPKRGAQAVSRLKPKISIPIHWGTFHPFGMKWLDLSYLKVPPGEFSYWVAQYSPESSIKILKPGEQTKFTEKSFDA
jgi:L-ascorbate metabolism protein UlaG (beta-lactamase superfamily)